MGKNLLIIAIVVVAAYFIGVESQKSRGKNYEDLRHQIERLLTSPQARKSRKHMKKDLRKAIDKAGKNLQKMGH